jgi:hypothetical protein
MNSVDRMDQKRATNPTRRREKKIYMSLFTYVLDLACAQAHSLLMSLKQTEKVMPFVELKRRIAQDLVTPWRCCKVQEKCNRELFGSNIPLPNNLLVRSNYDNSGVAKKMPPVSAVLGTNIHPHMIIENLGKNDINCFFCLMRGMKSMTIYGCVECKKGYHVNCFTAYHCAGALTGEAKVLSEMLIKSDKLPRASNKKSKYVGTISDIRLPEITDRNKLPSPKQKTKSARKKTKSPPKKKNKSPAKNKSPGKKTKSPTKKK